jgi:hypothetical protein
MHRIVKEDDTVVAGASVEWSSYGNVVGKWARETKNREYYLLGVNAPGRIL